MNYLRKTFLKRSAESFAHVLTQAKSLHYSNEQVIISEDLVMIVVVVVVVVLR